MMMGRQAMMLGMLDLKDEQRARIRAIQRETASKVRRLWVQMADEADRLRDLYAVRRGRMGMMGMGGAGAGKPMSGAERRRMMEQGDHRRMTEGR